MYFYSIRFYLINKKKQKEGNNNKRHHNYQNNSYAADETESCYRRLNTNFENPYYIRLLFFFKFNFIKLLVWINLY